MAKNITNDNNIDEKIVRKLNLHADVFEKMKATMQLRKYNKKDVLINSEIGRDLYFIVKSGIARSYIVDDKSREFIKTLFIPGAPIASIFSATTGKAPQLIFDCLTDCEFYVGNYKEFRALAEKDLEVARNYFKLMEVVFLNAEERIFELTLNAEDKYKLLKKKIPYIENLIPQYQIASYLNITNVQLSRVRKKILFE